MREAVIKPMMDSASLAFAGHDRVIEIHVRAPTSDEQRLADR